MFNIFTTASDEKTTLTQAWFDHTHAHNMLSQELNCIQFLDYTYVT
jgi:hypothetical protein